MTLIDIEPLKERIDKEVEEDKILSGWGFFFKSYLNSESVVNVVRCKECKYELICNHSVQHTTYDAHSVTIGSKTVEWCSYGERRDNE